MSDKKDTQFYQEVLDICLTAGRLMIEGGSEMYRVEDTMMRIAKNAGLMIRVFLRRRPVCS